MDERQIKQRDVTATLLHAAASEIEAETERQQIVALIASREFEPAVSSMEEAAASQQVSLDFWWNLKKAAELLGLSDRRKQLQVKYQECKRAQSS
jgi:hypothetical protein